MLNAFAITFTEHSEKTTIENHRTPQTRQCGQGSDGGQGSVGGVVLVGNGSRVWVVNFVKAWS